MMQSTTRSPLQENPSIPTRSTSPGPSPTKRAKKNNDVQVFTFSRSNSPVQVQILSTHTIFDLVDIFCKTTTIGANESVTAHLWDVYVPGINAIFHSEDTIDRQMAFFSDKPMKSASRVALDKLHLTKNAKIRLKYDYGSTSYYQFELVHIQPLDANEDQSTFPRKKQNMAPASFQVFETSNSVNLDTLFPEFDNFIRTGAPININLFQAGRKKNYGFCQKRGSHMIFLPAKTKPDLTHYLYCFDFASNFDKSPYVTWYSLVIFPKNYSKSFGKYAQDLERGFCEMEVVPETPSNLPLLNKIFPKTAALAGFNKDKKIPKGWICFKNKTLTICTGSAAPPPKCIIQGTAFTGQDQHKPVDKPLFQLDVDITSLHHLFCVVEGLLRTL